MALTRKFLSALGIDADKIDEIISAHAETVDALKADRDKYREDAEKLPDVQKELDKLKGDGSYKEKYEKEHADFEAFKTEQTAKETKAKKSEAYKTLLKQAGISDKHLNAILRASDVDSLELDDSGAVKDAKKATEAIKSEWSDFITSTGTQGAKTATPPSGDGSHSYHGSGRAAQLAAQYQANLYGVAPSGAGQNSGTAGTAGNAGSNGNSNSN